jgi:hypothetical protein
MSILRSRVPPPRSFRTASGRLTAVAVVRQTGFAEAPWPPDATAPWADGTGEGPPDNRPRSGMGRVVQSERSSLRSDAEGALDRPWGDRAASGETDPGHGPELAAIGQQIPPMTSSCHSSIGRARSQRRYALLGRRRGRGWINPLRYRALIALLSSNVGRGLSGRLDAGLVA